MVARSLQRWHISQPRPEWKRELAAAFTSAEALLGFLGLDPARMALGARAARAFPLRVPRAYAALMRRGDPDDPLLRQVLPLAAEQEPRAGFGPDPVGDGAAQRAPGLLHKYHGRALLIATGACAVHCRYCFRRHYPYAEAADGGGGRQAALAALRQATDVTEVILSGGDPLMLDDEALETLIARLEDIRHLQRLRLHTRLPTVLPSRVTEQLCVLLRATRLQTVIVVHVNHPAELGAGAAAALARLRLPGVTLLNQSVLLRGVNDRAEALADLSMRLFAHGVLPYYLHLLDPVAGAAHFDVGEPEACGLLEEVRARLPGYLVPRLVRERPGAAAKTPVI